MFQLKLRISVFLAPMNVVQVLPGRALPNVVKVNIQQNFQISLENCKMRWFLGVADTNDVIQKIEKTLNNTHTTTQKLTNNSFRNTKKHPKMLKNKFFVSCETTAQKVSFERSDHRILCTDSKVRTTSVAGLPCRLWEEIAGRSTNFLYYVRLCEVRREK